MVCVTTVSGAGAFENVCFESKILAVFGYFGCGRMREDGTTWLVKEVLRLAVAMSYTTVPLTSPIRQSLLVKMISVDWEHCPLWCEDTAEGASECAAERISVLTRCLVHIVLLRVTR